MFAPLAGCGPAPAADLAAGKALAEDCAGCHGDNGVSQMPIMPSLAGQPDDFIQWQLVFFRGGTRKSEVMEPIAESLNNPAIRNLGAYFASLPPKPAAAASPDALAVTGEKLALQHHCRSCHGNDFQASGRRPASRANAKTFC